jgi:formate hydrogenlyase subunit 6/NADH:ubiquinone oxidoreductase subunit I
VNIFYLIYQNLRRGPISYTLPHEHECTSNQYRGLIINDAARCIGCAQCAYVCPTAAIEVTRSGDTYQWTYDPGQCAFCGCCIDRCKPRTLMMQSQLPPLYSVQGELKQVLNMVRKRPAHAAVKTNAETAPTAESTKPMAQAAASLQKEVLQ